MQKRFHSFKFYGALAALFLAACGAPTPPPAPTEDIAAIIAMQLAYQMQTQTAAAYTPTLPPTPSATPTLPVTETPSAPQATSVPIVMGQSPCYVKPGETAIVSNVSDTKRVKLIGVGSIPGWYVILNPYFYVPCWIRAENLKLGSDFDLSAYPTVTP